MLTLVVIANPIIIYKCQFYYIIKRNQQQAGSATILQTQAKKEKVALQGILCLSAENVTTLLSAADLCFFLYVSLSYIILPCVSKKSLVKVFKHLDFFLLAYVKNNLVIEFPCLSSPRQFNTIHCPICCHRDTLQRNHFPIKESSCEHNNPSLFMVGSKEKASCGQGRRAWVTCLCLVVGTIVMQSS